MKTLGPAFICLAMLACSSDFQLMKTEDRLARYGSAIRWGLFETAADFQDPKYRTAPDLGYLKNIHVTAYDPIYRKHEKGSDILKQTVEIRYYHEQTGVEKAITDRQIWHYDKDRREWFLESKLPSFKPSTAAVGKADVEPLD